MGSLRTRFYVAIVAAVVASVILHVLAISSATSFTGCEEGRRFVIGTNP